MLFPISLEVQILPILSDTQAMEFHLNLLPEVFLLSSHTYRLIYSSLLEPIIF